MPFEGVAPLVSATKPVEVLARLTLPYTRPDEMRFASIHSDPPGRATEYPLIVRTKLGKGNIVWSALPIESIKYDEYKEIFANLLFSMDSSYKPSFKSDAPDTIEITLFEKEGELRVNLINVYEVAKSREVPEFTVSVKCDKQPKAVKKLPLGEELQYSFDGEYVTFNVKGFKIFDMFKIEL